MSNIRIEQDNILLVDGEIMQAEAISPEKFAQILTLGKEAVINALDAMYLKYSKNAPNVQRGSIWVMRLNEDADEAISLTGQAASEDKRKIGDSGTFYSATSINAQYHPYWDAVKQVGLIPETRADHRYSKTGQQALYLLVRDTPFKPVED